MAHELYKNTMAYSGEQPWHKLGIQFAEDFTAEQAIEAAGLGFTVSKRETYFLNDEGDAVSTGLHALVNDETLEPLGSVGPDYSIVQNMEGFKFFDTLLGEGARYHTAGAVKGGRKVWLLARMPDSIFPVPGDKVDLFILLVLGHDGLTPVSARFTPIRVVCNNTLTAAMSGSKAQVSIRHTVNAESRLQVAGLVMKNYAQMCKKFGLTMEQLASVRINDEWLHEYENRLFGHENFNEEDSRARIIREKKVNAFRYCLMNGMGVDIPGVSGSAWGALNAAIEYADFYQPLRSKTERTDAILFGSIQSFKDDATEHALALAGIK